MWSRIRLIDGSFYDVNEDLSSLDYNRIVQFIIVPYGNRKLIINTDHIVAIEVEGNESRAESL